MYNEELKNRYLQENINNESTMLRVRHLFDNLAEYEAMWGADICTKSESELKGVIEKVLGVRTGNRLTSLSSLRSYARWCIDNGVDGACDGLLQISDFGLESIQTKMLSSPRQLQEILNAVFPAVEEYQLENVYRGFYWMAFSGINEDETVKITADHIDPWDRTINYDGCKYRLYEESIPVFQHLSKADVFVCDYKRYKKVRYRAPGKEILRGIKADGGLDIVSVRHSACREFRQAIARNPNIFRLNYRNVWLSGLFYRASLAEAAGESFDFMPVIKNQYKHKDLPTPARLRQIKKEFTMDYARWKEAFGK